MGVQINGSEGNVIATKGTYSGNVTIGGTLTYEDVTNIDSVGLITARSGIKVTSGDIAMDTAGNITLGDSGSASDDRLTFGAGTDLSIYHDGSNSRIHSPNHSLFIRTGSVAGFFNGDGTEDILKGTVNGAVELYYDNSKKLETTSAGASVTGSLSLTDDLNMEDGDQIEMGTDNDFKIFHSTNNYLESHNDVEIHITAYTGGSAENMAKFKPNGAVELYHNNTKMIETISTGTSIPDGKFAKFGDGNDMSMGHNTYNYITYTGADLLITGDATNQIKLMPKSDEAAIICKPNAEVELFHDGALQCETSANGLAFPNGKGIDFSAASGDGGGMQSELLADYEEGIYSPSLYRSSSSVSYLRNKGRYIRIGNMCFVWFDIQTSGNNSSGSGAWRVSLPFTFANNSTGTAGLNNAGHGAPSFRDMSFFTRDQGYKTSSYINGDYIELRYINASNTEQNMIETGSDGRVTGQAWGYLSQAT